MIYKLLKHKISKKQLISFSLINIIGLSIIFLGLQLYQDISPIILGKDAINRGEYIVLTKKVNTLKSIIGTGGFSKTEIRELDKQDFIDEVGVFETSLFNVKAQISLKTLPFNVSTDLFFEAVPENFIDIDKDKWRFDPQGYIIPIILPKSYLDLYNFGFATSRKLPQLTEESIGNLKLDIKLYAEGHAPQLYEGKIVGFSKRINSILVPLDFLKQANKELTHKKSHPTRVIIKVNDTSNKELSKYITTNNYQVDGNQLNESKSSNILYIVTSIVLIVGVLICLLSCYILILSIYLLLEKNLSTLKNLSLLGYSRRQITSPYKTLILIINIGTFIMALINTYIIRLLYLPILRGISPEAYTIGNNLNITTYILALISLIVLSFLSIRMVNIRIKEATHFL